MIPVKATQCRDTGDAAGRQMDEKSSDRFVL